MSRRSVYEVSAGTTPHEWRAVTAPADFATRVVALALEASELEEREPSAMWSGIPRPRESRVRRALRLLDVSVRTWLRRAGVGVGLALCAGAAAALSFGQDAGSHTATMTPAVIERPVVHAATAMTHAGRSEHNVGTSKPARTPARAVQSSPVVEMPSIASVEETLLPPHLHVPPCQCTLSAVVCSCVE